VNNYVALLSIKYKTSILSLIICIIFLITLGLSIFLQTYTSYSVRGIYQDYLIVSVPISNSDAVNNGNYLMIDKQRYYYKVKKISELKNLNYINYQDYYIEINKTFKENEVVEITFYYKKQRIIQKILNFIF